METKEKNARDTLCHGIGIGTGRVCGRLRIHRGTQTPINTSRRASDSDRRSDPAEELARLTEARRCAMEQIKALYERAKSSVGEQEAQIFEIHQMLLEDEDFVESLEAAVGEGQLAEDAVTDTVERFSAMMRALNDPYLSARVADLQDIGGRLCHILSGEADASETGADAAAFDAKATREPYILVADDLTPSETVVMDKSMILGFVTFGGTPNSHTAILARAMGIPALVNTGALDSDLDGHMALLDAGQGTLLLDPDEQTLEEYSRTRAQAETAARARERYLRSLLGKPARTRSGHAMMLYANIGDPSEVAAALAGGAEGIGLLRSEFLYLSLDDYPTEDALFNAYRKVAAGMEGRRVVIRTLDIGADKQIPYFGLSHEENPALGFRGVRLCLAREAVFKTQLRAILRASAYGRVAVMIPMVVSVEEVRQCRALLETCRSELRDEGREVSPVTEFGIMIETPAAALMSEELAAEVDFFSVGTNDLAQYTLAADRQNPAVTHICEENLEPVLRLVDKAAYAIHRRDGWIGVCGELAADPALTQRFADMKIDELSVSTPYLLPIRGRIMECD